MGKEYILLGFFVMFQTFNNFFYFNLLFKWNSHAEVVIFLVRIFC